MYNWTALILNITRLVKHIDQVRFLLSDIIALLKVG